MNKYQNRYHQLSKNVRASIYRIFIQLKSKRQPKIQDNARHILLCINDFEGTLSNAGKVYNLVMKPKLRLVSFGDRTIDLLANSGERICYSTEDVRILNVVKNALIKLL